MQAKILIVEDNPQNRMLIKDILVFHGFEVAEAGDGMQGVAMAKDLQPDLILMDLQMPGIDGFAAARIIKQDPLTRHIRIIAVTSFAMKKDKDKVMRSGFDGYISKPIKTRELPDMIKKELGIDEG